jgi:hypothetical protein
VASEWHVEIGVVGPDDGRARALIGKLREAGRHVAETDPGVSWRVTYTDFESYDAAREALGKELDGLTTALDDDDWRDYLTTQD